MIFAEKRKEDGGDANHYTLRWFVWNGNMLGTYGVHFGPSAFDYEGLAVRRRPQDPEGGGYAYGASRDYHTPATPEQIAAYEAQQAFYKLPDNEQQAHYDAGTEPDHVQTVSACCYWDNVPCHCDGSGLVEIVIDDERAFAIAAMMADV